LSAPANALTVVLVIALGAVAVSSWRASATLGQDGAPQDWAADIGAVASDVERATGWSFDEPVDVRFVGASRAGDSADDARIAATTRAMDDELARALGASAGTGPESGSGGGPGADGPDAWYDPATRRITVARADLDEPGARRLVVHELTHALQHQTLGAVVADASPSSVERALLEGHAQMVAADDAAARGGPAVGEVVDGRHALGEATVRAVLAWRGAGELRRVLGGAGADPGLLFDPVGRLTGGAAVETGEVSTPPALDGALVRRASLGPLGWLEALAEPAGLPAALRAAYGWRSDVYELRLVGDRACVSAVLAGEDVLDGVELQAALLAWATASPDAERTVRLEGDEVLVTSCETPAPPGRESSEPATAPQPPAVWAPLWVTTLVTSSALSENGPPAPVARCAAIDAVAGMPLRDLADPEAPRAALEVRFLDALPGCDR